jgi:FG-GAP-like repeat
MHPHRCGLLPSAILVLAEVAGAQVPRWKTIQLDAAFRSEGVAVADVDCDGRLDVLAGEVWYSGLDWRMHEIAPPGVYDPMTGYSNCFIAAAADVDGDGWPDLLSIGFPGLPARWFRNPGDRPGHWRAYRLAASACNESPLFVDVNGDGRPDLLLGIEATTRVAWATAGPDPREPWHLVPVNAPGQPGFQQFYHGLGFGDLNGDGRPDVLTPDGWYEAPPVPATSPWLFHPVNLHGNGPTGPQPAAQMCVADFDGDGDADIATSSPHSYGVWWWEQTAPGTFTEHLIDASFSQSHALVVADINGDGLPDLVTGKRYYAHNGRDPGEDEPPEIAWFELSRDGNAPKWTKHVFDNDSGVGTQFEVHDMNADGLLDVIVANKHGVYYFEQTRN